MLWNWRSGGQPAFTPEELYGIDVKADDGKPTTGTMLGYEYGGNNNLYVNISTNVYALNNSATTCWGLVMVKAF